MKSDGDGFLTSSGIEKKLKYPQPHNIFLPEILDSNPALRQREIEYLHSRAKHLSEYRKSKQTKRLYDSD